MDADCSTVTIDEKLPYPDCLTVICSQANTPKPRPRMYIRRRRQVIGQDDEGSVSSDTRVRVAVAAISETLRA